MNANLPDLPGAGNTILALMDVTRRQWQIGWRPAPDRLPGELADYAWPTGGRAGRNAQHETPGIPPGWK